MIVVTDTSVVLNCWLRPETLLADIYEEVLAPEAVRAEFERKAASDPRFTGLHFPRFIAVAAPVAIPPALASNPDLDPGEIAALALALERGIPDVIIDEHFGRAVAVSLGLRVSGLLGVLIGAKQRQRIPELSPLLDQLVAGARFWISPGLRERVLPPCRRKSEHMTRSILTLLLTASIALGLDAQTKAEVDELIKFVQTSGVRFIRNGKEYPATEGAQHLRDKLAKAGDRVKTTDDFINGIASKSYFSGKPYLVKFADGRTQPTGDWLKARLAEMRKSKR